jgi:cytochrome c551/c552
MRSILRKALAGGIASFAAFAGMQPALADCRAENAACVKGATSPFDSVACGSLYRTCAAHHADAAQQQIKQMQNVNKPAVQNPGSAPGGRSGRR